MAVLFGNGNGSFAAPQITDAAGLGLFSVSLADMNGDGKPDIIGRASNGSPILLLGNGDGTFRQPQTFAVSSFSASAVAVADVNSDGTPDLIASQNGVSTSAALLNSQDVSTFTSPAFTILKRDAVVTVTGAQVIFDNSPHAATVTVTGNNGEDLSNLAALTFTNLADQTSSASPPVQPGTYEVFASFTGNASFNAIASFDTGKTVVIQPRSALQSVPTLKVPKGTLIAGQKISPIRLTVRLSNTSATTATGQVIVNVALSASPTGTTQDPIAGTIHRKVVVRGNKTAAFGAVLIRSLPAGVTGTLNVLLKLSDATGAFNLISAGTIVVTAPVIDLAGASVAAPLRSKRARKISVTVNLTQNGNIPLTTNIPVQLFLSTNQTLTGAIDLGQSARRLSIRPGRKGVLHLVATIPSGTTPGTYFVIAQIDPANTLGDSNTGNNVIASLKSTTVT